MFSFHSTKVFHSIEGGLVTFKDSQLLSTLKALKNFGITDEDEYGYIGQTPK